jgi:hypothetical protein
MEMSPLHDASTPTTAETPTRGEQGTRPRGGIRLDWLIAALSAWFLCGLYLDGWAHAHVPALETFFTPWHAVLYSGFAATALALGVVQVRNMRLGYSWREAPPAGYGLSLVGAGVFLVGGVLDLLWHSLFGIEVGVAALLSPTHLLLAAGGILLVSGPLRAAWQRIPPGSRLTWRAGAPALLALTYSFSGLAFFTAYAHPFVTNWAASTAGARPSQGDLFLMNADGTGQTRLTVNQGDVRAPRFSPDGTSIVFGRAATAQDPLQQLYIVNADGSGLRPLSSMRDGAAMPSWSPDGTRIAYVGGANGQIYLMAADGTNSQQLTHDSEPHWMPSWSPDGTRIAYINGANGQIYILAADGTNPRRLTHDAGQYLTLQWSPDGGGLAVTSDQSGQEQIYLMRADGSGLRQLTWGDEVNWGPAWSPDEARIAFAADRDGHADIYVMRADGSHPANLTNNSEVDSGGPPAWSADGRKIAYTARDHQTLTPDITAALGIVSVLLQAALLMSALLLLLRRWRPPFGAITLLQVVATALIGFLSDQHGWVVLALITGLVADALVQGLKPAPHRPRNLRLFSFVVPTLLYSLYFLGTYLYGGGIGWSAHLTAGTAVLSGVVGILLSLLVVPSAPSTLPQTRTGTPKAGNLR